MAKKFSALQSRLKRFKGRPYLVQWVLFFSLLLLTPFSIDSTHSAQPALDPATKAQIKGRLDGVATFCNNLKSQVLEVWSELLMPFIDQVISPAKPPMKNKKNESIQLPKIPKKLGDAKTVVEEKENKKHKPITKEELAKLNSYFLKEFYLSTLGRAISREEHDTWMDRFEQGADREGIYRAIVLGPEYQKLEAGGGMVEEKFVEFAIDFMKVYVGIKLSPDSLKEMNRFAIKRLCVEKTLDVLDTLLMEKNDASFLNWYAVFASDMAVKFPKVWKLQGHKEVNKKLIKDWAMSVPYGQSKSETIIRLHKVFNSLVLTTERP
jgi:hypothetical protein